MIRKLREKTSRFLFREEGGKKVLNRKHAFLLAAIIFAVGLTCTLVPQIVSTGEESQLKRSDVPIVKSDNPSPQPSAGPQTGNSAPIGGVADHAPRESPQVVHRRSTVRYRAKQVIGPGESVDRIPRGSNFVGKLLGSIDTRAPQSVQVILPYGGSGKSGGSIPPETILFGQASYSGQGDRVYLNFDHGVLPDGQEIAIQARALSSKDYTPGVVGDFHSNTGNRIASVLGLSMVGGMSEVMVEKEALGQTYMATPKATLKNGFYNGVSKVTQMEAGIQAEKLAQTPEYVTVEAGADLIISLISSYGQGERQQ